MQGPLWWLRPRRSCIQGLSGPMCGLGCGSARNMIRGGNREDGCLSMQCIRRAADCCRHADSRKRRMSRVRSPTGPHAACWCAWAHALRGMSCRCLNAAAPTGERAAAANQRRGAVLRDTAPLRRRAWQGPRGWCACQRGDWHAWPPCRAGPTWRGRGVTCWVARESARDASPGGSCSARVCARLCTV